MENGNAPGNPGKIAKILTIAALILLGLFVAAVIGIGICWNSLLGQMRTAQQPGNEPQTPVVAPFPEATAAVAAPAETEAAPQPTESITNVLLIGQNQNLADSMILVSLNRETGCLSMISFLRDLYVTIPAYAGHGADKNRINAAYYWGKRWSGTAEGGMELLRSCIRENFGIPVEHCIAVDFDVFTQVIDILGGVEIDLTEEEARYLTRSVGYVGSFQPGRQTLSGREALAYSRIRKIDSDIQRTSRQRRVLSSLVEKCRSRNLIQLYEVASAVVPMVTTDMTQGQITQYLLELLPMLPRLEIQSTLCPVDNATLPGSCWDKKVKIGGTDCAVIACNAARNQAYLRDFLGYPPEDSG